MSRNRWNFVISALLFLNLIRWGAVWSPVSAHPVGDEPAPAIPEPVLTSTDEEWEAVEVAGTNSEDLSFVVAPLRHGPEGKPMPLERVGCAALRMHSGMGGKWEGRYWGDHDGWGGGDGDGPPRMASLSMAAALVVTKWRVKGHMHRARGRL